MMINHIESLISFIPNYTVESYTLYRFYMVILYIALSYNFKNK